MLRCEVIHRVDLLDRQTHRDAGIGEVVAEYAVVGDDLFIGQQRHQMTPQEARRARYEGTHST